MRIMSNSACEELKKCGRYEEVADLAHYQRFLGCFFNEGDYVSEEDLPITFEDYIKLKKDFPGWSVGRMSPLHAAWRSEYALIRIFPMNVLLDSRNKK